jgi:hypothetical protein
MVLVGGDSSVDQIQTVSRALAVCGVENPPTRADPQGVGRDGTRGRGGLLAAVLEWHWSWLMSEPLQELKAQAPKPLGLVVLYG